MAKAVEPGTGGTGAGIRARLSAFLHGVPPEALAVGLGVFALLSAFVAADPNSHATFSTAPFTDEGFNLVNARNMAQLGTWTTDEWNLHLVNLPFSLLEFAVFKLLGVGIVQARLAMVVCTSLAASSLVWGLRRVVGRGPAVFAGVAFACSGLILFYGRLAFLEDLVVLGLTLGAMTLANPRWLSWRGGLVAGACFAVAIGTKPSAAFSVVGILATLGLVWGWSDLRIRRWIVGACASIAVAGILWIVLVGLPNRDAVAVDLRIWPPYKWNLSPGALVESVRLYLSTNNDRVLRSLLLPLIGLAGAGTVAIVAFRRRLSEAETRLAVAALAWAVFGFGILMLVSYRPNRYVVPLVPSLAILAAIGLRVGLSWLNERLTAATSEVDTAAPETPGRPDPAASRRRAGLLRGHMSKVVLALALAMSASPGLYMYARWNLRAEHDLVAIQDQFAEAVPPGQTVAGQQSALFLMRSRAITTIVGLANNGDLYSQGTRYYLITPTEIAPRGVPDSVWKAREEIMCADWNGRICLYRVK
jgi:4-amino-4-deoxy-L-arabinose transferase-like glycosyltransferase